MMTKIRKKITPKNKINKKIFPSDNVRENSIVDCSTWNNQKRIKMAFDFKKEYKEFYAPKNKPSIIEVPKMNYIAVRGKGDPNIEGGEYKQSIGILYGIAFTIKRAKWVNTR